MIVGFWVQGFWKKHLGSQAKGMCLVFARRRLVEVRLRPAYDE